MLMKQSLDGSLPKICQAVRPFDQDGPHSRTQFNIGTYGKFTLKSACLEPVALLIKQSLDCPLPKLCLVVPPSDQDGCTAVLSLKQDPMGNSHTKHLVWNQQLNQNQTSMEQSLDGPLPKFCPAVTLSHQDGHHGAVALLLKAAFDPGERLQAPGSLWFHLCFCIVKQTFTRAVMIIWQLNLELPVQSMARCNRCNIM